MANWQTDFARKPWVPFQEAYGWGKGQYEDAKGGLSDYGDKFAYAAGMGPPKLPKMEFDAYGSRAGADIQDTMGMAAGAGGPTIAQRQLEMSNLAAQRQNMSMAQGAYGTAPGAARRSAQMANAQLQGEMPSQMRALRAREMSDAAGLLGRSVSEADQRMLDAQLQPYRSQISSARDAKGQQGQLMGGMFGAGAEAYMRSQ